MNWNGPDIYSMSSEKKINLIYMDAVDAEGLLVSTMLVAVKFITVLPKTCPLLSQMI